MNKKRDYEKELNFIKTKMNLLELNNKNIEKTKLEWCHVAAEAIESYIASKSPEELAEMDNRKKKRLEKFNTEYKEILDNYPVIPAVQIPYLCRILKQLLEKIKDSDKENQNIIIDDITEFYNYLQDALTNYEELNIKYKKKKKAEDIELSFEESVDLFTKGLDKIIECFPDDTFQKRSLVIEYGEYLFSCYRSLLLSLINM